MYLRTAILIFSFFANTSFADECLRAANDTVKCGGICAFNPNGSVSCSAGSGLPGECLRGWNDINVCGGKCMLQSNGVAVCSSAGTECTSQCQWTPIGQAQTTTTNCDRIGTGGCEIAWCDFVEEIRVLNGCTAEIKSIQLRSWQGCGAD